MRRSPDVSPRRLSDISPQLRQLKYLVVDEAIKEDLKWSRSVEDLTSGPVGLTSIEERILRITGYYGYQPWAASYKSKTPWTPRVRPPVSPALVPGSWGAIAATRPAAPLPADTAPALQLSGETLRWSSPGPLGISDPFSYTPPLPTHASLFSPPCSCVVSQWGDRLETQCSLHRVLSLRIRKCYSPLSGCSWLRDRLQTSWAWNFNSSLGLLGLGDGGRFRGP